MANEAARLHFTLQPSTDLKIGCIITNQSEAGKNSPTVFSSLTKNLKKIAPSEPEVSAKLLELHFCLHLSTALNLSLVHPDTSIGQIYNIGLSHAFALNDYLKLTATVFNKKAHIHYLTVDAMLEKYGDTINPTGLRFLAEHMCFTIDKAVRELEYRPSCTPEEAVIETALWAAQSTNCQW